MTRHRIFKCNLTRPYGIKLQVECYVESCDQNPAEEVFSQFRNIVDMYILAGSELEINIETAMRNKILKV